MYSIRCNIISLYSYKRLKKIDLGIYMEPTSYDGTTILDAKPQKYDNNEKC